MKKVQYIISVSVFTFVFFSMSFGQSNQIDSKQESKIAVVYSYEFSDEKTGIQEFVIESQKVDDKFKVQIDNLNKKYDEIKEIVKKIHIANNCHYNCKAGKTEALFNELEKKDCIYRSEQNDLKQEIKKYSKEFLEPIRNKIKESLKLFAKSKGFDVVLDGSEVDKYLLKGSLADFPNITKDFIKFYNEKFVSLQK